jgi:hypothetical protein
VQVQSGEDPLAEEPRTDFKYSIPADIVNAAFFLGPMFTTPVVGTVDLANFVSELTGTQRKAGPVDTEGQVATAVGAATGMRPFWASPSRQERLEKQDMERRIKALAEKMPSEVSQTQDIPGEVILRRGISAFRQSPTAEKQMRAAVLRTLTPGETPAEDLAPLQAFLLDNGMPETQVLAKQLPELRAAVVEAVQQQLAPNSATK